MEVIQDILENRKKIERCIANYGFQPEHNLLHYAHKGDGYTKCAFLYSSGSGIMATVSAKGVWRCIAEPLGKKEEHAGLLNMFISYALKHGKKAVLELTKPAADSLRQNLNKRYRALDNAYVLYWPVYSLRRFDPSLPGKDWKKLRNVLNCFKKCGNIEVMPAKEVPKEKLRMLIREWRKRRNASDKVNNDYYFNIIESGFEGFDMTRSVMVNGKPCSITGGWRIPNSKGYYSSLGIINYAYEGLGEYANVDDLAAIKAKGFSYADFGGSDKQLLTFKKKFQPETIYKTYIFSVVSR